MPLVGAWGPVRSPFAHQIADQLRSNPDITDYVFDLEGTDLFAETDYGDAIYIYVLDEAPTAEFVRNVFTRNTNEQQAATLFFVNNALLPAIGDDVVLTDWQAALHAVTYGKFYAYGEIFPGKFTAYPLHAEPLANLDYTDGPVNPDTRRVSRGPEVDFNRLRIDIIQSRSRHMAGTYYFADFSERAWWREPGFNRQQQQKQQQRQSGPWRDYTNQQSYKEAEEAARKAEEAFRKARQEQRKRAEEQYRREQEQRRQEYEDFRNRGGGQYYGWNWDDFFGGRSSGGGRSYGSTTGYASTDDWTVIGCQQNASQDVAKKAYRSKIASVHPDRHPSTEKDKWTAEAQKVNAAWDRIRKSQGWQ